jgi:hypothetical protein
MTEARILIALMEHDLMLSRTAKSLEEIPEKRAILQLRGRLQEIEEGRAKAHAYVSEVERKLARANDELAALESRIAAEEHKSLSGAVTNPKELQHLTKEIASLKRSKITAENTAIALMEKLETGTAQVAKVDAVLAEGRAKEQQLISAFQARGGDLQTQLARVRAERDALSSRLPESSRERYEKLRAAKHGIAVGVLKGAICSACRIELPAERVQALEAGADIASCPACRRILVVRQSGSK